MYEFKEKYWKKYDSGSPQEKKKKNKVFSNQSSLLSDSKKEMQIDDIKIEILTRSESVRYLEQLITFHQQETTEIKNRIRTVWTTFHKYRQELTSKNYLLKLRLRLFDAAINSDDMLRIWNMDAHKIARKKDTIETTQNVPTHHANKKKIQKNRETQSQDQRRIWQYWLELYWWRERRRTKLSPDSFRECWLAKGSLKKCTPTTVTPSTIRFTIRSWIRSRWIVYDTGHPRLILDEIEKSSDRQVYEKSDLKSRHRERQPIKW